MDTTNLTDITDADTLVATFADYTEFTNPAYETGGFTMYDNVSNSIITSFRGSAQGWNFAEYADGVLESYVRPGCNSCNVHSGFMNSYNSNS